MVGFLNRRTPMDRRDSTYPGGFDPESGPPTADTAVLLRLLIVLMGEEVSAYDDVVRPPEHLRRALRCAPTPVLRGVLMDAVAELGRRREEAG